MESALVASLLLQPFLRRRQARERPAPCGAFVRRLDLPALGVVFVGRAHVHFLVLQGNAAARGHAGDDERAAGDDRTLADNGLAAQHAGVAVDGDVVLDGGMAPHPGEPREAGCPCRTLSEQEVQKRLRMGRHAAKKLEVSDADITFIDGHFGAQSAALRRGRDDFLIRRSDGVFAYQLAMSADDLDMGITRVVRARDLLDSTPRQIWLIETLGGQAPEYAHAPLLVAPDGRKLSKREGDLNMEALRQKYTPEQLTGRLAKLAGLRPTDAPVTAAELAADFSWDKVPRTDIPIPDDF